MGNKILKNSLIKNTAMLYILQFSTYFFSLITVPYQTRVLGPEIYGKLGVAVAVMTYFQLFMDFGFMLSATEDISKHRGNKNYINKKITSITILKGLLAVISISFMAILCIFVSEFTEYTNLYIVYILAYVTNAFLPDYLYRGIEQMSTITIRTVVVKMVFTVLIFFFLKTEEDYLVVPILLLIGNVIAVIISYVHVYKVLGYQLVKIKIGEIYTDFKRASTFFFSRIATTVYSTTNTILIGMIDKSGTVTGFYTSADKIVTIAKSGFSPISDSLYPYMIRNRDFKLVKKILVIVMPIIILGCVITGIYAEPICIMLFGEEFYGTAPVLVAMLPAIVAVFPSYILGFPTLGAMGLSRYANYSIIVGTITHIVGILLVAWIGKLGIISLAVMSSISEWSILIFRFIIVIKNKNAFKSNKEGVFQ